MIKYYCDWCNAETSNWHGGQFGRRVPVECKPQGKMNVLFTLEFSLPKPDHLCHDCYVTKLREAVDVLAGESGNA